MKNSTQKEELSGNRMLLPEISTTVNATPLRNNYGSIHQFERNPPPERRTPPASTPEEKRAHPRSEGTNSVNEILAPSAMAVLRNVLGGNFHEGPTPQQHPRPPFVKPDGGSVTIESRGETRVPVLKMSTGSFLVTPTPPVSLSFPNRPPLPQRLIHNTAHQQQQQLGLQAEHVLFTTPERRINLQNVPNPPISLPSRSAVVSNYLVHGPSGQYCIVSGAEVSPEGRMIPMEIKRNAVPPPTVPQVESKQVPYPTMFVKPMKTTVSLTPKLQTPPASRPPQPQLSQKLVDRPKNPVFMEPTVTTPSFTAAAETLKNLFLSGSHSLPITPIEEMGLPLQPPSDYVQDQAPVNHKRRKTSTPATLDEQSPVLSPVHKAGLDLLFKAVKTVGDTLPQDSDSPPHPRVGRNQKASNDQSLPTRLAYCLDPALRRGRTVLDNFTGVYPLLDGSYVARCRFKGIYVLIGSFKSAEDAARAYDRVILGIRGRTARTNYHFSEYLNFELQNAKRAFEAKYKQCERTRRGSAWPWARAAQTLLANDDEGSDDGVPELMHTVGPLSESVAGESVFRLLQNVMLKRKDLNGTFDLIQSKIRQLQTHIQSGLSTEEECDCVGQYACVANILGNLVSMQHDWERRSERQRERTVLFSDSPSSVPTEQTTSEQHQVHPLTPPRSVTNKHHLV